MRKLPRTDPSLDFIRLFSEFCKGSFRSYEPQVIKEFGDRVVQGITESVEKPHRVAGIRAELVFQTVVAGLGEVKLLKAEDAGDVFWDGDAKIAVPDFTVVTKNDARLLVEVKLCSQGDVLKISDKTVQGYIRYAEMIGSELFFAVFWQGYGTWTLNRASAFHTGAEGVEKWMLSYHRALFTNEFNQLGDRLIGTAPPFRFRIYCDPIPMPKDVSSFDLQFQAARVEIMWRNQVLRGETAQFVWTLMSYGGWPQKSQHCMVRDGDIYGVEFIIAPHDPSRDEEPSPDHWDSEIYQREARFTDTVIIAPLSTPITNAYLHGAFTTIHTNNDDSLLSPGSCRTFSRGSTSSSSRTSPPRSTPIAACARKSTRSRCRDDQPAACRPPVPLRPRQAVTPPRGRDGAVDVAQTDADVTTWLAERIQHTGRRQEARH